MYAILDVETTGLNAKTDRITEIAIFIHDGEKIVNHFESLVNPGTRIPYNITMLTGITDEMVREAPEFPEIARKIVELTEDCILVAHNAAFDYNFLRYEYKRLFFDFKRKTLCTKKLSQRLLPELKSFGLGQICKALDIQNHARHRAGGDARSTVKLFEHLLNLDRDPENISLKDLKSNIPTDEIDGLPEVPGVYYFHDEKGQILYIGKSVNIRQRVLSHLSNNISKRAIEMRDRSFHVTYEITGSDLIAQLLESKEIKRYKPLYNRSLRRCDYNFGLFSHTGKDGYIRLEIARIKKGVLPLTAYASRAEGRNHLIRLINEHELCQKLCGIYKTNSSCFHHQIGECHGACIGKETQETYNDRVMDAISKFTDKEKNYFIIDDGKDDDELSVVKVENGRFMGFGYLNQSTINGDIDLLHDAVNPQEDNRDARIIIKAFLRKYQFDKVIIY